jgi:predicted acetyltransferase
VPLIELQRPSLAGVPAYAAALRRGWSPDNVRGKAAADEHLERIALNADAFVGSLVNPDAQGPPVTLPDGSTVRRLPGFVRWIWDGEFAGSIAIRWQPGTRPAFPLTCLGTWVMRS